MGKLTEEEIEIKLAEIVRQIEYEEYLKSRTWRNIRIAKLTESNFKCETCGYGEHEYQGAPLDVHHITYERFGGKEELRDLEVLCRSCHEKRHGRKFPKRDDNYA